MSSFNRGKWSELYAIIYLLLSPKISIANANLDIITNDLYNLKKLTYIKEFPILDTISPNF